jgi:opacity protein-like surface antigen
MRRIHFAAYAAAALLTAAPAAEAAPYDFGGFYFGGHVGVTDAEIDFDGFSGDLDEKAVVGGFQVGYNVLSGDFLWGVETDLTLSSAHMEGTCPYNGQLSCDILASPVATVRPRVGYLNGDWLFYATAGAAVGVFKIDARDAGGNQFDDTDETDVGLAAGLGVERMLGDTVGVKAEYRYMQFWDVRFESESGGDPKADFSSHSILIGVNWHF